MIVLLKALAKLQFSMDRPRARLVF